MNSRFTKAAAGQCSDVDPCQSYPGVRRRWHGVMSMGEQGRIHPIWWLMGTDELSEQGRGEQYPHKECNVVVKEPLRSNSFCCVGKSADVNGGAALVGRHDVQMCTSISV